MKKLAMLLFVAVAFIMPANAQRKILYLEPFTSTINISPNVLADIRARIYNRVTELGRVTLVDGHNYGTASARTVGADYILRGKLNKAVDGIDVGEHEGEDRYQVAFEGVMQLIDAHTGAVVAQKSMDGSDREHIQLPDMARNNRNYRKEARRLEDEASDKAYAGAVRSCGSLIEMLIDENIKIEVHITGITKVKKDEVLEVTIDRGTFSGVSRGERFVVNTTSNLGNYAQTSKIAEIRVNQQPAEHSANCKVTSGKKELKAAMQAGQQLTVVSRTAKLFD
jgi:hypothetical protein